MKNAFNADEVVWGEFRLGALFEKTQVQNLKYKTSELPSTPDDYFSLPALTAGVVNQGLNNYVPRTNATILKDKITISANGANTGATFYQKCEFTVLQDAYALDYIGSDDDLNDFHKLFLTGVISSRLRGNYDWSYKAGWNNIKNLEIRLPITPKGEIDFDFMEQFISELEAERISELEAYLDVTGLKEYSLTEDEQAAVDAFNAWEVVWGEFRLGELFESETGDFDIKKTHINGKGTDVITAGKTNNGVLGKTDVNAKIFPKGSITVDMFGSAFYRDFDYKLVTHARTFALIPKESLTKNAKVFLTCSLGFLEHFYDYDNMCSWNKICNTTIRLPITPEGEIDFDFMETFIGAMQKLQIEDVVKYADDKIAATKEICGVENRDT